MVDDGPGIMAPFDAEGTAGRLGQIDDGTEALFIAIQIQAIELDTHAVSR